MAPPTIFHADPAVFTLSIHQLNNYPQVKPPSTLDVDLEDGIGDHEYLARLDAAYTASVAAFQPDLILYVAGADPYFDDQLGGLELSKDGLLARDRLIFHVAVRRRIPIAVVLAGGYARYLEDTVEIHANTARCIDRKPARGRLACLRFCRKLQKTASPRA